MIEVNSAYKRAVESNLRQSYMVIKYGLYDKKAKNKVSNVIADKKSFSNLAQTYDEIKTHVINYISCEPNRVVLDDTFAFLKSENPNIFQNIGYWSNYYSNGNGLFMGENPYIEYIFSEDIKFIDLTLHFQEVVSDLKVEYYYNNSIIDTINITNNTELEVLTTSNKVRVQDEYFDRLKITFIKTGQPYRYVKFNEIDFGVYNTFSKNQIKDIDIIDEMSIDSSELSSNSLNATIESKNGDYDILNPNNKLNLLQERQQMTVYHYLLVDNSYVEIPLGTFLLKTMQVENATSLKIEAYDDIFFMNKKYYGSKFYINEPIRNIFIDIFNYFNYDSSNYLIDNELNNITLTGYIPVVEMREALRIVAEAGGCVINKTRYGITYIFKTYDSVSKVFELGQYSYSQPQRNLYNSVIDINEYTYKENNTIKELFNATLSTGQHKIKFKEAPLIYRLYENDYSLLKGERNNDYDIISISTEYCEVNVKRETNVFIKGCVYDVDRTVVRYVKRYDGEIVVYDNSHSSIIDEYAITSVDNTLITSSNGYEIASWKLSRSDLKISFETNTIPYIECGDTCQFETKYKDNNNNYIKKTFIPTYINFTKSIKQKIEGE